MTIVKLDGIKIEMDLPDENPDNIEKITPHYESGTQEITQPTELGEAMRDLDNDTIESGTRMSKIDMRTRLQIFEINPLWAVDSLVSLKFLPTSCLPITRQRKRLLVSLGGKGREEKVKMVTGEREQQAKSGFGGMMDNIKNRFGGNNGA